MHFQKDKQAKKGKLLVPRQTVPFFAYLSVNPYKKNQNFLIGAKVSDFSEIPLFRRMCARKIRKADPWIDEMHDSGIAKIKDKRQKTKDKRQRTKDKRQKIKDKRQKTKDKRQETRD